jgi:GNAT superfamily N-acetyltransferase
MFLKFIDSFNPLSNSSPIIWKNIDDASDLVANSLYQTPSYVEMFRGEDTIRIEQLKYLFKSNFFLQFQNSPDAMHFIYNDNEENMLCFYMFVPNDSLHFSIWQTISGAIEVPFYLGFDIFYRIIKAALWFDNETKELMKERKYLCLQRMAVNDSFRDQGLGTKYLSQSLQIADDLELPVMLGTQDKRNLNFYYRL